MNITVYLASCCKKVVKDFGKAEKVSCYAVKENTRNQLYKQEKRTCRACFRVRKFFSVIYTCCYVIINVAARFCLIEQKMEELRRWKNILAMKRCRKNSKS